MHAQLHRKEFLFPQLTSCFPLEEGKVCVLVRSDDALPCFVNPGQINRTVETTQRSHLHLFASILSKAAAVSSKLYDFT